jgi:hypothetical protein
LSNQKRANILAEAYFALSEGYKKKRLNPGARTEWSKAAALSAATVAIVDPLRPAARADTNDPLWPYINPLFAMLCAYGHARNMFEWQRFDVKRRVYLALRGIELPSLDPIIQEVRTQNGRFTSTWDLTLSSREMAYLDLLVSVFDFLPR